MPSWRLRNQCSWQTKYSAFQALISSHVNYMLPIYGAAPKYLLEKIEKLQKRAVKVSMNPPQITPSEQVHTIFHTLPIEQLRDKLLILLLYPRLHTMSKHCHNVNTRRRTAGLVDQESASAPLVEQPLTGLSRYTTNFLTN